MAGKEFQYKQGSSILEIERENRLAQIQEFDDEEREKLQNAKQTDLLKAENNNAVQHEERVEEAETTKLSSTPIKLEITQYEVSEGLEKFTTPNLYTDKDEGQQIDNSIIGVGSENHNVTNENIEGLGAGYEKPENTEKVNDEKNQLDN